jgi:MFS family permease
VDEIPKKKSRGESWVGLDYSVLKKKWYYYVALICIFFTGFSLTAINGVAVQHMKDVGLDIVYVTNIWSIHSLFLAVFKFLTGFFYDKLGLRKTMLICSVTTVLVMVSLACVTPTPEGKILAAIYSIFSGLALPLETIMLPIIAGDLFGQKSFAKVLGIISAVNTAGYALASPLMNLVYDRLGNYKFGLLGSGAVMVMVIIVMQFIITKANKVKKQVIADQKAKNSDAITE